VFLKRQKAFCVDETFSVIAILLLRPAILLRSKSYLIAVTDDAASPQLPAQVLQSLSRLYLEKQPDNFTSSISGLHSPGISWKMPKAIKLGISSRVELVLYAVSTAIPARTQWLAGMSRSIPLSLPERFVLSAWEV
jgi:hypothetical protein